MIHSTLRKRHQHSQQYNLFEAPIYTSLCCYPICFISTPNRIGTPVRWTANSFISMAIIFQRKTWFISVLVVSTITLIAVLAILPTISAQNAPRTFTVNHETNQFQMDGQDFQYVAGSYHYFRTVPAVWRERLRTMRAAGLNVVDTYVEWALHNPRDNEYTFDGIANLEQFIEIAASEGFYVILRPGPYICAERDNGGVPYWLFNKYPNIQLRTSDANYLKEVEIWYGQLMPRMERFLYGNGGPIIMVQVENEYGVSLLCDKVYLNWLRDETYKYTQDKALLFTVDIPNSVEEMRCGYIENVFFTTDFGIDKTDEMENIWRMLREIQPTGPLVNSEYYPGWLTHWQEENQRRSGDVVASTLKQMLLAGASVNFYMFFGGTNFGFTAGANDWGIGSYMADITSYDYDAVMTEAGDPTDKYNKVREVIGQHLTLSAQHPVPAVAAKMSLPSVNLTAAGLLLSPNGRRFLGRTITGQSTTIQSFDLRTFEQLNQFSGFVLYETDLPKLDRDPAALKITDLRDRAQVFIDQLFVGTLSRENTIDSLPIQAGFGSKLQILVENQGRINFNDTHDIKGILGEVTLQTFEGYVKLNNWQITGYPLENYDHIQELITNAESVEMNERGLLLEGPAVLHATFNIAANQEIFDTYLDPIGWGKGILFINGFNLGRYWPLVGPQKTQYVPKDILRAGSNSIVLVEYQKVASHGTVHFTATPRLDGED